MTSIENHRGIIVTFLSDKLIFCMYEGHKTI